MSDSSRRRRLNVLQRITLGYIALTLPMAIAGVLIITTVALVEGRYVAKESRYSDVGTPATDLRQGLALQQGHLQALAAGSQIVSAADVRSAHAQLVEDAGRLQDAIDNGFDISITAYPAFTAAWDSYVVAEKATLEGPPAQVSANAAMAASAAERAMSATLAIDEERNAGSGETDTAMWNFVYATTGLATLMIITGAIAGFIMAFMLPRGVARQLRGVVGSMRDASSEMLGVGAQVAATAVETASSVSEVAATVDEVRQTSLLASQRATAVADDSARARAVAAEGMEAAGEALHGMAMIQHDMTTITESVARMNEHASSVGEVMDTMSALADQSSLLAVNAALEAASAGQYGKGFAVVADEMRGLASGSKKGVIRVRTLLADVQSATAAAVRAVGQGAGTIDDGARRQQESSNAIDTLAGNVEASAETADQILSASEQQLVGMDQIADAMDSIDQAAANNAAAAKRLESSLEELKEMAAGMQTMVATINPLAALRRQPVEGVDQG